MKRQNLIRMLPDKESLLKEFLKDPNFLIDTFKKKPTLVEWVFKGTKEHRKYVKMPTELNLELRKIAEKNGIAEGLVIGVAILLLTSIMKSD